MAKKKKVTDREELRTAAEYYKLNTKAVDDLVNANEENSPQVTVEELRKYNAAPKAKLSDWLKYALIKGWFAGAVCFFFLWGLGYYLRDQLDQMVLAAVALGFVTDLLTNNVIRFLEKTPGANNRWMMVPRKGFASLPLNLLYAVLVIFCVVTTYNVINGVIVSINGETGTVPLGVEPILFGTFTVAWDSLLIKIKYTFKRMLNDAKRQAGAK